jgi:hypothetical protein
MPIKKIIKKTTVISGVTSTADGLEQVIRKTGSHLDSYVAPMRESVFKRYPTLFTLLVTLGATATFLGLEQLLLTSDWLRENPWALFIFGVTILVITGRTYKKLG